MAGTTELATTTLTTSISATGDTIAVASATDIRAGLRVFVDKELMTVLRPGVVSGLFQVARGTDGTGAAPHSSAAVVTIGRGDQFYMTDPLGVPPNPVLVSPWINLTNGTVWYAQGDALGSGAQNRYWVNVTTSYAVGALGVVVATSTPSSSS